MSMVKCEHCGKSVSDSEKLCPYCDEKIHNELVCPNCHSKNVALSDIGPSQEPLKGGKLAAGLSRQGLFGGLLALLFVKKMNPDAKESRIEYVCKDCEHKFRRY